MSPRKNGDLRSDTVLRHDVDFFPVHVLHRRGPFSFPSAYYREKSTESNGKYFLHNAVEMVLNRTGR